MNFLPRQDGERLKRLLRIFPAVMVHGPRQCGKSTLVKSLLPTWLHMDLENPADLSTLRSDLAGYFDAHPRHAAIDEAQRLPEIFPLLRHVLDRSSEKGRIVLLGSANALLLNQVSESLAGRIGFLELTPFRACELANTPHAADRWFWGGYPPAHRLRGVGPRGEWLDSYVTTFLERDLPNLGLRLAPARLRTLWRMLTHVHGNLLNVADLGRSLSVSSHTVNSHLDVLESTFMIRRLHPYYANVQKRLTKSPKIYVRDTGLLHFLAGLRRPSELEAWPRRGASFEGLVIEEIAAWAAQHLVRPETYFWRTHAGAEVDLLLISGQRILPIEIKLGSAVDTYALAGLRQCMKDLSLERGWVVYSGKERRKVGESIELVPWADVARGKIDFA